MSIDAATIAAAQGMAGRSQGAGMSSQQVNQMQQQQGQQKQKEDQKKQMLIQILSPEAREVSWERLCSSFFASCHFSGDHKKAFSPHTSFFLILILILVVGVAAAALHVPYRVPFLLLLFFSFFSNRQRLATVRLVKPEKADNIESYLLQQAQSGKLRSQVQEGQLIEMMEQLSEQSKAASKVTFSRRKVNSGWSDSEDDDDSDLLWETSTANDVVQSFVFIV